MRIKAGSVPFLKAAGSGFGIGLSDDGHRVEFIGDWRALAELEPELGRRDPVYLELEEWQLIAVDDDFRLPLSRPAMVERARFIRSALGQER